MKKVVERRPEVEETLRVQFAASRLLRIRRHAPVSNRRFRAQFGVSAKCATFLLDTLEAINDDTSPTWLLVTLHFLRCYPLTEEMESFSRSSQHTIYNRVNHCLRALQRALSTVRKQRILDNRGAITD